MDRDLTDDRMKWYGQSCVIALVGDSTRVWISLYPQPIVVAPGRGSRRRLNGIVGATPCGCPQKESPGVYLTTTAGVIHSLSLRERVRVRATSSGEGQDEGVLPALWPSFICRGVRPYAPTASIKIKK
jgi:hypothetical protein